MKAITTFLALFVFIFTSAINAQIEVTANSVATDYSTLKEAFDAINIGTHTGNITVLVKGITNETSTAELLESGNPSGADYNSILIEHEVSIFLRIISGNLNAPVIDLNGADNVTINGRDSLTIQNTVNQDFASVIRFRNGATNNVIKNCIIRGACIGSQTGNVFFAGSDNSTGNINNLIEKCRFVANSPNSPDIHVFSSGTPGAENSSNTIRENNFIDFRNSGIFINSTGNGSSWIIHGNSFFQDQNNNNNNAVVTPLRFIPGSGSVSNKLDSNFIGGTQPFCLGSQWTNTGTATFRAITVQCGSSAFTSVRKNVISNFHFSSSGNTTFRGIEILQGKINCESNLIGSETVSSSIDLKGNFRNFGIFDSSPDTLLIKGNTIANITNITIIPSTSGGLIGIDAGNAGSSPVQAFIRGNRVFNLRTNSSLTNFTGNIRNAMGINFSAQNFSNGVIDSNTVHSISSENATITQLSPCGIRANNLRGNITRNIVYDIRNAGTAVSTIPTATGICVSFAGINGAVVANNMVTLGISQTTNTAFIGINLQFSSNLLIKFLHNTVRIEGTAASGVHNSFAFYRGTLNNNTSTNPIELKNNIFDNARSGGTGNHFAVGNQGTSPLSGWNSDSIDFNLLNSASAGTVAFWRSSAMDINTWRDTTNGDKFSPSGFTQIYQNTSTGNLRLNVGLNPTPVESGGMLTALAGDDIDGNIRPMPGAANGGGISPDIGASESDMIPNDIFGPVISCEPLLNSQSHTGINLTDFAFITDNISSINTSPLFRPRIYFKKSQDSNLFLGNTSTDDGWKFVSATDNSSPFDFNIDYSILTDGSVSAGDTIEYFIVAQDNSPGNNVSAFPKKGFTGVNVNSITTAPDIPLKYIVTQPPLSGVIMISHVLFNTYSGNDLKFEKTGFENPHHFRRYLNGKQHKGKLGYHFDRNAKGFFNLYFNAVYPTITDAINDINARGVDGPLQILLGDTLFTNEIFPIELDIQNEFKTTLANGITIKPAPNTKVAIIGNVPNNPLLIVKNTANITIDGRSGSNRLDEKDIMLMNEAQINAHLAFFHSQDTITEQQNKLFFLLLKAKNNIQNNSVGLQFGNLGGQESKQMKNVQISNVDIAGVNIGINVRGGSNQNVFSNFEIDNAKIVGSDDFKNFSFGINVQNTKDVNISNSEIGNFEPSTPHKDIGININDVQGTVNIKNNLIHDLDHTGNNGFGGSGIAIGNTSPETQVNIVNNVIYGMRGDGTNNNISNSYDNPSGILVNSNCQNVNIFHNSVNMTGNTLNKPGAVSAAVKIIGSTKVNIKNNNLVNNLGINTTGDGSVGIAIVNVNQLGDCDNNNFSSEPVGSGNKGAGKIGGSAFLNLAEWIQHTQKDRKSLNGKPGYTSDSNLSPNLNNPDVWNINNAGAFTGTDKDFFGNPRSTSITTGQPDIGAFEFIPFAEPFQIVDFFDTLPENLVVKNGKIVGSLRRVSQNNNPLSNEPDTLLIKYFQGAVPPGIASGDKHAFGYIEITPVNPIPAGTSYTFTFNIDSLATGNITSPETNIALAKYSDGIWEVFPIGTGNLMSELDWEQKTVTVSGLTEFSIFALTESNNPLPVELSSFNYRVESGNVKLNWSTSYELNNSGFDVERKIGIQWTKIGFVRGVNNQSGASYEFTDRNLSPGIYGYRLKQIDFNGNYKYYELGSDVAVSVPEKFELLQNYPNPFNPATSITFRLNEYVKVKMILYDITGREIKMLLNEFREAGTHSLKFDASSLSSGTYFYKLIAGKNSAVKKMTLLK